MDRRSFVEASAGAALAGFIPLDVEAESPLKGSSRPAAPADLDAYLATVDVSLRELETTDLNAWLPAGSIGLGEHEALARGAIRTLYLSGMLADLPVEMQIDERVQRRLWSAAPEIDATMDGMRAHLEQLTSSEWADLQLALRDRSNPAIEIAVNLTSEAGARGMSKSRRLQTRAIVTQAALQLRAQPPEHVVTDYIAKMDRVIESDATESLARRTLAARIADEAFWGTDSANATAETPRGLKTMGWGLLIAAVGGLMIAAEAFVGVFVITVGAIFLLVGLIQLLIHAARSARD